ncbi:MAG: hypothetical protein K1X65_23175 [Caldilineales bacterium]|nr:hypothetical protein [Caldilineales bacterium]MCW5858044.1 hypothetical protein [Caldilineales bacterium]
MGAGPTPSAPAAAVGQSGGRRYLEAALYLLLALALAIPAWAPLTRPGLPATAAGPLPALEFYAALQGDAPILAQPLGRWQSPGPWPFWTARFFHLLGADGVASLKLGLWLALIILAVGVYLWGGRTATHRGGVLAAVLVLFTPALLGGIYQGGEWAAVWVLAGAGLAGAGLAGAGLAGWGVLRGRGPALGLAAGGGLIAAASLPGLGLLAGLGLAALALGTRRWTAAVALAAGGAVGLLLSAPWSRPAALPPTAIAPLFYQLIEPGWLWGTATLAEVEAPVFSLGLALVGLLLMAVWSFPRPDPSPAAEMTHARRTHAARMRRTWLLTLTAGLVFALLSLFPGLPLLASLASPLHLLLISLPFLAVAAASAVYHISDLREMTPLWAALLILVLVGAGPSLSPAAIDRPLPERPAAIFGQDQVILLDLRSEGRLQPGETVIVHADWLALKPADFDYNIFLHLDDAAGATLAQVDVQPQNGARPMTGWRPGEIISDSYSLAIPPDAPAGLRLRLGLYNWQTLARLPVGGEDGVELMRSD